MVLQGLLKKKWIAYCPLVCFPSLCSLSVDALDIYSRISQYLFILALLDLSHVDIISWLLTMECDDLALSQTPHICMLSVYIPDLCLNFGENRVYIMPPQMSLKAEPYTLSFLVWFFIFLKTVILTFYVYLYSYHELMLRLSSSYVNLLSINADMFQLHEKSHFWGFTNCSYLD